MRLGPHGSDTTPGNPRTPAAAVAPLLNPVQPYQWLAGPDFEAELNQARSAGDYPDMITGRCQDSVFQYRAILRKGRRNSSFLLFDMDEDRFNAKNAELTPQGYAIQYQNTFQDCEGRTRYNALWVK